MARVRIPLRVQKLLGALHWGLRDAGIRAEIDTEPVQGTRLHRASVDVPRFRVLHPSERQDPVWRIAQQVLIPEGQLRISMIMTVRRQELAGMAS